MRKRGAFCPFRIYEETEQMIIKFSNPSKDGRRIVSAETTGYDFYPTKLAVVQDEGEKLSEAVGRLLSKAKEEQTKNIEKHRQVTAGIPKVGKRK